MGLNRNMLPITFFMSVIIVCSNEQCFNSRNGQCYQLTIDICQCLWCTSAEYRYDYYFIEISNVGKIKAIVNSGLECTLNSSYCLTFQYYASDYVNLTVSLRPQGHDERQLWTGLGSGRQDNYSDNRWSDASVPIPNTDQVFSISIKASLSQSYGIAHVKNIVYNVNSSCLTKPPLAELSTTASSSTQQTTLKVTTPRKLTTNAVWSFTPNAKQTTVTPSLMPTAVASINQSDDKTSEVTSPVTAVAVSVTVVMVVIVVVTVLAFIKRRQVCLYVKRLDSRYKARAQPTKPDLSLDMADMQNSQPPSALYSVYAKNTSRPSQSSADNAAAAATSIDHIRVYQNISKSSDQVNINSNNDYVDEPNIPNVYNRPKECDGSNEESIGVYHVIQPDQDINVILENPRNNDAIYSLAKTPDFTSDQKVDNSPYNALNLPGGATAVSRDTGSHDVYNHLSEEEGTYNHVNVTRTNEVVDDEYSHIQHDNLSSEM